MYKYAIILGFLLTTTGCEREPVDIYLDLTWPDAGEPAECTHAPDTYVSELQTHAAWESPSGVVSEATIDYGNQFHFLTTQLSPVEVAQVAYWTKVAAQEFLIEQADGDNVVDEELQTKLNLLSEQLQHTHYLIAANDEEFYRQFDHSDSLEAVREEHPSLAAFVRQHCYELPDDAVISSIYKNQSLFTVAFITHELTHPIGQIVFEDGDGAEHSNPDLWARLDDERSIQARAIRLYEENKDVE